MIGVGSNDRGYAVQIGGVIGAVDKPHQLIEKAFHDLGRVGATRVTTFTDGDKMLRS